MKRIILGAACLAFPGYFAFAAGTSSSVAFEGTVAEIEAVNRNGSIQITGRPAGTSIKVNFQRSQAKPECKPIAVKEGNKLSVGNESSDGVPVSNCPVDIEIEVPNIEGLKIMADVETGQIRINDIKSHDKLDIKAASGNVTINNSSFDNISVLVSARGDVMLASRDIVSGVLNTKEGNIKVTYLEPSLEGVFQYIATSGNIDVEIPDDSKIKSHTDLKAGATRVALTPSRGGQHAFECQALKGNVSIRRK